MIGGGLIGAEVVETLIRAKVETQFLIRQEWFWPIALDGREAAWIAVAFGAHGVGVQLERDVEALEGAPDGTIRAVRTAQGSVPCDLAVVAIGVVPNTDWLAGTAIERDRGGGILVDQGLATSGSEVYAAGDCASVRWYDGSIRPEQLWYTARDQGRVAGKRLLGEPARYQRGTWYNSAKLMDVEYTTAGLVNVPVPELREWYHEETGSIRSTTRIVCSGDRVVGFNALGRRWDHSVVIQWIDEGRRLGEVLDHLQEAAFDTEFVPPLVVPRVEA